MARAREQGGQASVELVAVLPAALVALAVVLQLALAGEAVWRATSAARAAARAQAIGRDAAQAARAALPARLTAGLRVRALPDGLVRVEVAVPAVVGSGRLLTIGAAARLEPGGR